MICEQFLVSVVAELVLIWQEIGRAGYFSSMFGFRDIFVGKYGNSVFQ